MSLGITELELTDTSTISIPTDAILILFLLIVFALIGYYFNNILDNQTNQFVEKVDDNLHLELVKEKPKDQLTIESATVNHEKSEKPNIKKLNFIPPTKFWGIGSLAVVAIGGSSLLRIQSIQNSYKGVNTSHVNIKTENQSKKSLNQAQTKIKKIIYVDPLLSTNNSSKNNNYLQVQQRRTEDFFSF
ncbi:hypothetical protein [Prochlorococcus marinus]|uniref:Uncharacterized protein n=1 Tax=Prochlorococcus marinus str. PAC1 TaxID=59924 RepID=A0A0A2C4T6_PROMR|nr:hypothetical protein [Prochlorococcus marinus]KGG21381.1 hypothetical protein EV03_0565 [Prochlorococcus marinus str. PAC1]